MNTFGNAHRLSCASNERNYARHIWDRRDARGCMGALATVVIPWFADRRYGHFANDPSLTEQQIATILAWADAGSPAGDPHFRGAG